MVKPRNKKAAIEMSVGTIVVVVLSVSLVVLGMVLIRKIMCTSIGLTDDIGSKVSSELNKLFGSSGGEVVCIGDTAEGVKMSPGQINVIWCSIRAPELAEYSFTLTDYSSSISSLSKDSIKSWFVGSSTWISKVGPGDADQKPKKILRLKIPENAPEGNINFKFEVKKDGVYLATEELDFQISRTGLIKSAVC